VAKRSLPFLPLPGSPPGFLLVVPGPSLRGVLLLPGSQVPLLEDSPDAYQPAVPRRTLRDSIYPQWLTHPCSESASLPVRSLPVRSLPVRSLPVRSLPVPVQRRQAAAAGGSRTAVPGDTLDEDEMPPKLAFLFLTKGLLPLTPLWERFFKVRVTTNEQYTIHSTQYTVHTGAPVQHMQTQAVWQGNISFQ